MSCHRGNGGQSEGEGENEGENEAETVKYWNPENGADEDSVPAYAIANINGYYNWYAATAGSGTYLMDSWQHVAPDSVCPAGWQLPINGNTQSALKSWVNLLIQSYHLTEDDAASNSFTRQVPLSLVYLGVFNFGSNKVVSTAYGFFWSSTAFSRSNSRDLVISNTGALSPQNNYNKDYGLGVRCLKK